MKRSVLKKVAYTCGNIAVLGFCGFYVIESGSLIRGSAVLIVALFLTNLQIHYVFNLKPRE